MIYLINRGKDESIKQYKLRICRNREQYDLSWQDVANLINKETGDSFGESKYRKWFTHYNEGFIDAISEVLSEDQVTKEIEDKTIEMKKERIKLQDQRKEYNSLVRNEARFEHLQDEIIKSVKELSVTKPLIVEESDTYIEGGTESALILSDWHKGLFARNHWNNFDDKEFAKRVKRLVRKTIEYNATNNVDTMHVFTIGDLVNGLIHVTTRIANTEDVISQTMNVAEVLAEVFATFAKCTNNIFIYFARGNHDRVTPNKHAELAKESFADVILWYLKARLSHISNIEFMDNKFDDEIITTKICGKNVFAVHGHRDKPSSVVQDLSLMTKIIPEYVFMGHYHHHEENEIQGVEVIVNSSLSGVDSYAKEIRKTSKPAQKLIIFSHEEGRLCTYNIRLDIK